MAAQTEYQNYLANRLPTGVYRHNVTGVSGGLLETPEEWIENYTDDEQWEEITNPNVLKNALEKYSPHTQKNTIKMFRSFIEGFENPSWFVKQIGEAKTDELLTLIRNVKMPYRSEAKTTYCRKLLLFKWFYTINRFVNVTRYGIESDELIKYLNERERRGIKKVFELKEITDGNPDQRLVFELLRTSMVHYPEHDCDRKRQTFGGYDKYEEWALGANPRVTPAAAASGSGGSAVTNTDDIVAESIIAHNQKLREIGKKFIKEFGGGEKDIAVEIGRLIEDNDTLITNENSLKTQINLYQTLSVSRAHEIEGLKSQLRVRTEQLERAGRPKLGMSKAQIKRLYDATPKDERTCPICLDDIVLEEFVVTSCGHHYCHNCRTKINKCAICRETKL